MLVHSSLSRKMSWIETMKHVEEKLHIPDSWNTLKQEELTARTQRVKIEYWVSEVLYSKYTEKNGQNTYFNGLIKKMSNTKQRINQFVRDSMNNVMCHPIVFVVGLYYLFKYLEKHQEKYSEKDFLLFYSVCTTLASKTHEDRLLGNSYYYNWFGWNKRNITLKEFSSLEFKILEVMDFKMFVDYQSIKDFITLYSCNNLCSSIHHMLY